MNVFYSPRHALHAPPFEIFDGGEKIASFETPQRAERILAALQASGRHQILPPADFGLAPILAVHDPDYIEFLRTAFAEWQQEATDYEKSALLPATFPPTGWRHKPKTLLGKAGYYMSDLSAPIVAGTFEAALASAHCALSAAQDITVQKAAFALCRPPGHHAGRANCAGYCYINNAAVAAQWLSARGKTAVLDIDYHAGNGTQDIFYRRPDLLTTSIHADPDFEYPYYSGYAQENGGGPGLGFHENFPLSIGSGDEQYFSALEKAMTHLAEFGPDFLVVSAGMDICDADPLGRIHVSRAGIAAIGQKIASLARPTAIVLEGGYNTEDLGLNMAAFLEAF
ncbi:MAG: histone deacetylase family protein [Anaerolineales bacterium]